METFKFASLVRPSYRYRLYSDYAANPAYNWRNTGSLSDNLSMYDTMGDGETQHTPDCLVQTADICDVLGSLAQSLHRIPLDTCGNEDGDNKWLRRFWSVERPSDAQIQFVLSLKYNPQKDTYINVNESKKSFSREKSFDKRWQRLENQEEHSPIENAVRVFCQDGSRYQTRSLFRILALVKRIAEVRDADHSRSDMIEWLKKDGGIFKDKTMDQLRQLLNDFELINMFAEGYDALSRSICCSARREKRYAESLVQQS